MVFYGYLRLFCKATEGDAVVVLDEKGITVHLPYLSDNGRNHIEWGEMQGVVVRKPKRQRDQNYDEIEITGKTAEGKERWLKFKANDGEYFCDEFYDMLDAYMRKEGMGRVVYEEK